MNRIHRIRYLLGARLAGLGAAVMLSTVVAPTVQAQPVSNAPLYYRMGGGSPSAGANHRGMSPLQLSLGLRANYSCGKFDIGMSWSNVMDGFKNLGATVSNAVKAGISSLPLYILQRAQPGLYQLFQNFSQKADLLVASSLKTCEEMEVMIKAGQDPYEGWVKMAKGETWKAKASTSGDVVQAKVDINRNEEAQRQGVNWVFGTKAGGVTGKAIQPIRDLSVAGYNVTLNRPTTSNANANYGTGAEGASRMVKAFKTPEELAKWSTDVLGDQSIYLCSQDVCPQPTTTSTASGLGPKYEKELDAIAPILRGMADSHSTNYAQLQDVSSPGMAISPQLMDAVRGLPSDARSIAVNRLTQELSMHRVIDKALVARNVLISGLSLPQATAAGEVGKDVQTKIDRLTQYINDMMFEFRIRKEMTSNTALAIMSNQFLAGSSAARVPEGFRPDPQPVVDGRVKE